MARFRLTISIDDSREWKKNPLVPEELVIVVGSRGGNGGCIGRLKENASVRGWLGVRNLEWLYRFRETLRGRPASRCTYLYLSR